MKLIVDYCGCDASIGDLSGPGHAYFVRRECHPCNLLRCQRTAFQRYATNHAAETAQQSVTVGLAGPDLQERPRLTTS